MNRTGVLEVMTDQYVQERCVKGKDSGQYLTAGSMGRREMPEGMSAGSM